MHVIHGPFKGQTGLGYATQYLTWGLRKIGAEAELAEEQAAWNIPGNHVVIDQPMQLHPKTELGKAPWDTFLPFFEFPPRPQDEIEPLTLKWPSRKILCCNPQMLEWVRNLQSEEFQTEKNVSLMQLGAFSDRVSDLPRKAGTAVVLGKYEARKGIDLALRALDEVGITATVSCLHPLHTKEEVNEILPYGNKHDLVPFASTHEDVQALFDVHHVAIFASTAEGWNMGLTEALGQGCVVVASDIPAHRYQYELLCEGVGVDEANKRMVLVPTSERPMRFHERWYPAHLYVGKTWLEVEPSDLAEAIQHALSLPIPETWGEDEFPLSWENAARRLINAVS